MRPATDPLAGFIAGFVAAEGTFTTSKQGRKFTFAVGLGATDGPTCEMLREYFGVGGIYRYGRRKAHYDDEVTFAVQSMYDQVRVVISFMDEHLPESYKRMQYLDWRRRLLEYWDNGMKRRRPCTVDGCASLQRAHGLCRHHLYEQYGY